MNDFTSHACFAIENYLLDLCPLPRLTFWDHNMKTLHAYTQV